MYSATVLRLRLVGDLGAGSGGSHRHTRHPVNARSPPTPGPSARDGHGAHHCRHAPKPPAAPGATGRGYGRVGQVGRAGRQVGPTRATRDRRSPVPRGCTGNHIVVVHDADHHWCARRVSEHTTAAFHQTPRRAPHPSRDLRNSRLPTPTGRHRPRPATRPRSPPTLREQAATLRHARPDCHRSDPGCWLYSNCCKS